MDKYKDFQDLPDNYDEQTLMQLFVKRNYSDRIDNSKADDIIIIDDIKDGFTKFDGKPYIAKKEYTKKSSYEERMKLKETSKIAMYQFPENNDVESVLREFSRLDPMEPEDYYTGKKVEAYLNVCRQIGRKSINDSDTSKRISFPLVYSLILIEAYYRGEFGIREMTKKAFLDYASIMFPDVPPYQIYQTVRSGRQIKNQFLNSLNDYKQMKENYPSEYNYAMKIFPIYYPDLPEIKSR